MVLLVVAALTAAAVGCVFVRLLPVLIADDAGMRLLRPSPRRWSPEPVLVCCGIVLAVAAPVAFAALRSGGGLTMAALPSAVAPTGIGGVVAVVCTGLGIGAAAGSSPVLAWIDVRIHRLPDRIVLPLLGLTAACWTVAALSGGTALIGSGHGLPDQGLVGHGPGLALVIGAVCGGLVLVVSVIGGRGRGLAIGLGDVKLAILVGALTGLAGTGAVLTAFVVAQLSACVEAAWQVLVARRGLATRLAYGPHLLLGMWTGPLVHAALR
ncbi:A24 family peptidase [Brevibacterium yomogidense]|uniref:prepilin peptidase n=1 Tax=Brevibacterium yomogidense TaxID=946573 RepID=UPI0018DEF4CB|nr:prepilin peptidase [Brevibacterium yomogidense]